MGAILTALSGIALGALILSFLGSIASLVLNSVINITVELLLDGWLTNFNILSSTEGQMAPHAKILSEVFLGNGYFNFLEIIMSLAWVIFAISFICELFKLLGDPGSGSRTPSVGRVVLKFLIFAMLIGYCYYFSEILLKWFTILISRVSRSAIDILTSVTAREGGVVSGETLFENIDDPSWYFFFCVMCFGLCSTVVTCFITYVERYIGMAIYIYLGPMCVAMGVNDATEDVAKKWILGIIGQMLAITLSIMLIAAAYKALTVNVSVNVAGVGNQSWGDDDVAMHSVQLIIATVLFAAAKNTEKFFNMLGFSTMNYGEAGRAFTAGLVSTAGALRAARSAADSAIGAGKDINNAVRHSGVRIGKDGGNKSNILNAGKYERSATGKHVAGSQAAKNAAGANQKGFQSDLQGKMKQAGEAQAQREKSRSALNDQIGREKQDMDAKKNDLDALKATRNNLAKDKDAKQEAYEALKRDGSDLKAISGAKSEYEKADNALKNVDNRIESAQKAYDDSKATYDADKAILDSNGDHTLDPAASAAGEKYCSDTAACRKANDAVADVINGYRQSGSEAMQGISQMSNEEYHAAHPDVDPNKHYEAAGITMDGAGNFYSTYNVRDSSGKVTGQVNDKFTGLNYTDVPDGSALIKIDDGSVAGYLNVTGGTVNSANGIDSVLSTSTAPNSFSAVGNETLAEASARYDATMSMNDVLISAGGSTNDEIVSMPAQIEHVDKMTPDEQNAPAAAIAEQLGNDEQNVL